MLSRVRSIFPVLFVFALSQVASAGGQSRSMVVINSTDSILSKSFKNAIEASLQLDESRQVLKFEQSYDPGTPEKKRAFGGRVFTLIVPLADDPSRDARVRSFGRSELVRKGVQLPTASVDRILIQSADAETLESQISSDVESLKRAGAITSSPEIFIHLTSKATPKDLERALAKAQELLSLENGKIHVTTSKLDTHFERVLSRVGRWVSVASGAFMAWKWVSETSASIPHEAFPIGPVVSLVNGATGLVMGGGAAASVFEAIMSPIPQGGIMSGEVIAGELNPAKAKKAFRVRSEGSWKRLFKKTKKPARE